MNKSILFISLFLISFPSYAYIGPGMGGGVIAAIIGFFAAILLALWGILYYPIKRALKKRKDKKILLKDSNSGTSTSFEGNYALKVSTKEDVLQFSYIGFDTQDIVVGNQSQIDIILEEKQYITNSFCVDTFKNNKKCCN